MSNLSDNLKQMAINNGLCQDHIKSWRNYSDEELIEYYVTNPCWCIERNFPSNKFIIDNFIQSDLNKHGIFINDKLTDKDIKNNTLIISDCVGEIGVNAYRVVRAYVSGNSHIKFKIIENAILIVDCYNLLVYPLY